MKKYELNPKEEVKLAVKPNALDQARKENRMLLLGTIALGLLAWFFRYVMKTIPSFYPLFLLIALIGAAGAILYLIAFIKGIMNITEEQYYITNVRVVVTDNDNNIRKELYNNAITKIAVEKVTGSSSDVILNPKEETDPAKLRKHKGSKPLYTADTVILHAVNANRVKELLQK